MGAITFSLDARVSAGNKTLVIGSITMSSSYATSGDTYTPDLFGLGAVTKIVVTPRTGLYTFRADTANKKIIARTLMLETGATAAADSTSGALAEDFAGTEGVVRLMGTAINTIYHVVKELEVPSARDLSAEVLDVFILGYG